MLYVCNPLERLGRSSRRHSASMGHSFHFRTNSGASSGDARTHSRTLKRMLDNHLREKCYSACCGHVFTMTAEGLPLRVVCTLWYNTVAATGWSLK